MEQAGVPVKGKGGGKGSGQQKKSGFAPDVPFRSRLNTAMQQKYKQEKSTHQYNTEETENEGTKGYMSTIECDKFAKSYSSKGVAVTKKQAEENAAMHAMEGEFPELFKSVPQALKKAAQEYKPPREEKKRKLTDLIASENAVSKLNTGITILIGRSLRKGEIEYTVEEVDGMQQCTVTLTCVEDAPKSFKGKKDASKRQAEKNAAEVCYMAYKKKIEAMIPEHEAKKAAKEAERDAMRAAKIAELEAEGEPPAKKPKPAAKPPAAKPAAPKAAGKIKK